MRQLAILLLIVIVIGTSCESPRFIYAAAPPNNPVFTGKNQSEFTAYYSSEGSAHTIENASNSGFDLQGSHSFGEHWALTANYFSRKEKDEYFNTVGPFDSSHLNYIRNLTEIGGGYFVPVADNGNIILNLFGGLGFGKFEIVDRGRDASSALYARFHTSKIMKIYFQPAINFSATSYFNASMVLRASFVHYGDIFTSYTQSELDYFHFEKIANKTAFFLEPTIRLRIGLPKVSWVKLDMTLTGCTNPYSASTLLRTRGANGSIGLTFSKFGH